MSTNGAKTSERARWPSPVRRAAIERREAYRRVPEVALGLAAAYAVFTPLSLLRAGLVPGGVLAGFTSVALVAMLALRHVVLRGRLPHRAAHAALGLTLATLVARGLLGWALLGEAGQVGFLSLIMLVVGYLCVSAAWAYALIAVVGAGWAATLWLCSLSWPPEYLPLLIVGAPVAIIVHRIRIQSLLRDERRRIGERRRQAQLLAATGRAEENERRFRGIFERIHDVYLRVGLDGRVEMISPSVTRFGFHPHELIGTDVRARFAPSDLERGQALIDAHGPVGDIEMRWCGRDGSETVVSVSGSVLKDAAGAPIGYEAILRDISQRTRLEAERREQEAELAHVLRLSSMGEMAAEMAHELTQPLAAIVNYAGACARYVRSGSDERAKLLEGLQRISAQGLRAGEIVHRIRSYVAKRPPQREIADLVALAAQAAHTVGAAAQRAGLSIDVEGARDTWFASVDAIQIEQVVVNLLLNAVEAVPAPGAGDRITVTIGESAEGQVEVAVRDPGCGLGALASRIFDPFFSTKASGLGMGLAISRSIVETHGGQLWATPNCERGTTFHFTVPRTAAASRDERAPAATVH